MRSRKHEKQLRSLLNKLKPWSLSVQVNQASPSTHPFNRSFVICSTFPYLVHHGPWAQCFYLLGLHIQAKLPSVVHSSMILSVVSAMKPTHVVIDVLTLHLVPDSSLRKASCADPVIFSTKLLYGLRAGQNDFFLVKGSQP